jgi:hypothetical protein
MPYALAVYSAEDWLRPGDDPDDEQAAQAAYIRHVEARDLWSADYAHMVVPDDPVLDEPWCGEFDEHDCGGADCPRRSRRAGISGQAPSLTSNG